MRCLDLCSSALLLLCKVLILIDNAINLSQDRDCLNAAVQIVKALNYKQALPLNWQDILGRAPSCLGEAIICLWQQYFSGVHINPPLPENIFATTINPACNLVGQLLLMLSQGNAHPLELQSRLLLPPAVDAIKAGQYYLFAGDGTDTPYEQDLNDTLDSATALFTAAYDYIANHPLGSPAFLVAYKYVLQRNINYPELCAYVLLALAALLENGDWRNVSSSQVLGKADIVKFMESTLALRPNVPNNDEVRETAIYALLNAGVIERKGDPTFSSELRNIKYFITPQTLTALQQLTANGAW